jgi:segregation and condensation protein B
VLDEIDRAIEAIVLVTPEPIEPRLLAQVLEVPVVEVERRCARLADAYRTEGRGFELARVAGGYRYQTAADLAGYVERFVSDGQVGKLSPAALETLAIVAYRQPISRAQMSAIRGVNVDGVVRTLAQRGLVAEVGRDPGPGQAALYGTTRLFLERLGLDGLDDLPPLGAHVPGADVVENLESSLRSGARAPAPERPEESEGPVDAGPSG